jgi:hypothetical protein
MPPDIQLPDDTELLMYCQNLVLGIELETVEIKFNKTQEELKSQIETVTKKDKEAEVAEEKYGLVMNIVKELRIRAKTLNKQLLAQQQIEKDLLKELEIS